MTAQCLVTAQRRWIRATLGFLKEAGATYSHAQMLPRSPCSMQTSQLSVNQPTPCTETVKFSLHAPMLMESQRLTLRRFVSPTAKLMSRVRHDGDGLVFESSHRNIHAFESQTLKSSATANMPTPCQHRTLRLRTFDGRKLQLARRPFSTCSNRAKQLPQFQQSVFTFRLGRRPPATSSNWLKHFATTPTFVFKR